MEYDDYNERAVTEILVNALIHRTYDIVGAEVHIDIFDDRLEVSSPGGMYDGTEIQKLNILDVPSKRRNPIIADFLGMEENRAYLESELEKNIIANLEKFMMELVKGFAFVERQQRIHTEKEDYYIDIVFYFQDLPIHF